MRARVCVWAWEEEGIPGEFGGDTLGLDGGYAVTTVDRPVSERSVRTSRRR